MIPKSVSTLIAALLLSSIRLDPSPKTSCSVSASNFNTAYQIELAGNAANQMTMPPWMTTTTPNPRAWEPNSRVRECSPGGKCGSGSGGMMRGMGDMFGGGEDDCECPRGYVCKTPNDETTGYRNGFERRCEKTYL